MNSVSVIIPTYNSWRTVKNCVSSLASQTLRPVEIIVVDNASTDATSENIKAHFPKVKLVTLNKNSGVTGGRNAGFHAARKTSDYYFFFDHDMIAEPNMLAELVQATKQNKAVGIVTPKIYYLENKKKIWSAGTGINLVTGQVLFRGGMDNGQYDSLEEIQVAPAALLVIREVMDKLKEFDNRYFAVYEDTDFCFRAKKLGFRVMYVPTAVAYHDLAISTSKEAERLLGRGYWIGRNRVLFMKDFSTNFFLFTLILPVYLGYYLYLAVRYHNLPGWLKLIQGTIDGYFKG